MKDVVHDLIEKLELESHPEGGYYRRTYESDQPVSDDPFPHDTNGNHSIGSAVIYLLPGNDVSHFHRLQSDEMWHYYWGSPLKLHVLDSTNGHTVQRLGPNLEQGDRPQQLIESGTWFGATTAGDFTLAGCTVWPEFRFGNFEMADRSRLIEQFPNHREIIEQLTPDGGEHAP